MNINYTAMDHWAPNKQKIIFYSAWFVFAVLQALFTELQDDEAYYWVYSRFPAWGYFDHPPLTAMLIKAGYALFENELGVRLVFIFMNLGTIALIEKMVGSHNRNLLYTTIISLAVLHIAGFMAVPDIPLMFFTALFFWVYRKFLTHPTFLHAIFLGLTMSTLLYSKYHGILIIFFTLLSHIKLLGNFKFWLAGITGLSLFLPHLYWQYQHDFISFRYHLLESNVNAYRLSFTTDYIAGQLLLAGPIAGFILLPAAFLYRTKKDTFFNALKFTMVGFYAFFLLSSFRGQVEANWTAPALVPLLVLSIHFLAKKERWKKALYKTLPFSLVLILAVRFLMVFDVLPVKALEARFHQWKQWPAAMKQATGNLPVVWNNSYQRASKYWFYSGQPTHSVNWYRERKNNFNYWPHETFFLENPVYHMDIYDTHKFPEHMETPLGTIGYRYDSSFTTFGNIHFDHQKINYPVAQGDTLHLFLKPQVPVAYKSLLEKTSRKNFHVLLGIFNEEGWVDDIFLDLDPVRLGKNQLLHIKAPINLHAGNYYMRVSIQAGAYPAPHNSDKINFSVK